MLALHKLRCILLLHLCIAQCCIYLMEQPRGSNDVLPRHRRFEEFSNLVSFAPCLMGIYVRARRISPWFDPIVCLDKHLPLLDHQGIQRIFLDDAPWRTNTEANSLLVKLSRTSHQFGHGLRNPQVLEMVLNLMLHVSSYLLQGASFQIKDP